MGRIRVEKLNEDKDGSTSTSLLLRLPVEGPLEEKLPGLLGEVRLALMWTQHLAHHRLQPLRPLLQAVLLLERGLEVLLQTIHKCHVTLAHPRGLGRVRR